jgi:hypothetical protein
VVGERLAVGRRECTDHVEQRRRREARHLMVDADGRGVVSRLAGFVEVRILETHGESPDAAG